MERKIWVKGGKKLSGGSVHIAGSSNQVTKCIIASMLTDQEVIIKGAPVVDERKIVANLYASLGGTVSTPEEDVLKLCSKTIDKWEISEEQYKKNRISILCTGPLLHRFGKVSFLDL